ncbi:Periplasmic binding protein-like I [Moorella glycerini]|uniref:D-allose-binding periplasmic protein n=1 Tax=Neomoorella stamsii TaxID=1266720 RepID=A0A9X7J2I8_9FIRM|nr:MULTISPECIES: substrate-binding domain-containing protein [Moorella]PRR71403.1 D-allose-binding periplasmic protein precursor [Moorella stamsii]CEP68612.1 Periplasmic binding protein-like I [Moorella glycerini]
MRKFLAFALVFVLLIGIAGCSGKGGTANNNPQTANTQPPATVNNKAFKEAEAELLKSLQPLPKASQKYKIAALLITLANPFWVTVKEGYEDAAREYGVTVDVMSAPKEDDVNSQLETLKTIVSKDYNAIAISAITPFNLVPGVAAATKKGIPVVAVGTSVDQEAATRAGARVQAFITSNFEDQGKLGAEYIIKKIGAGKVAIIEGLPGAAQSEARKTGAKKAFEGNKDITLVAIQPGNWDRQKAYNIAANLIQAHPDLKGIFCANDVMALGAVEALKAAGKKDQVTVVGVDFIDDARKSIAKGELDASVAMSPYLFGKGGLILALKVLEGHEIKQEIYWTPLAIVDRENVNSFEGWK